MTRTMPELEALIGFAPNKNNAAFVREAFAGNKGYLKPLIIEWLTLNGIPYKAASLSLDNSLVGAYAKREYLSSWRTRVNPAFKSLSSADVDLDALDTELGDSQPVPVPQNQGPMAIPADLIENLTNQITPILRNAVQIETAKARTNLLTDALASVDAKINAMKINLSGETKVEIIRLAQEATVEALANGLPPRTIQIDNGNGTPPINVGIQHFKFDELLRACSARDHKGNRLNVWLTGPTGSGKTSGAESVAKALNLPFGADSSLDADYKVYGFRNAAGEVVRTSFREIFEHGGVYVADEVDGWHPGAFIALNAPLANGFASFPDGIVKRHPDCIIIACANTWGLGATNEYVGRTKMDAASLDRFFPKIEWPYDQKLENEIARGMDPDIGPKWCQIVINTRQRASTQGLKVIVSPRSTYVGISLLNAGFDTETVVKQTLGAGLSPEQFKSLGLDQVRGSLRQAAIASRPAVEAMFRGVKLADVDWRALTDYSLVEFVEKLVKTGEFDSYSAKQSLDWDRRTRNLEAQAAE